MEQWFKTFMLGETGFLKVSRTFLLFLAIACQSTIILKIKSLNNKQKVIRSPWELLSKKMIWSEWYFVKISSKEEKLRWCRQEMVLAWIPHAAMEVMENTGNKEMFGKFMVTSHERDRERTVRLVKGQRTMSQFSALCLASWESESIVTSLQSVMSWRKWEDEVA